MKLLAFSDLHRNSDAAAAIVAASADADVVVGAGDFATMGEGLEDCLSILSQLRVPLILVAGNHERLPDLQTQCAGWRNMHVLHGNGIAIGGIDFFGVGFEIPGSGNAVLESQLSEDEGAKLLAACPAGAVLITHSPPLGIADLQRDGSHQGSQSILATVQKKQPRLHLCGHIHNAWGTTGTVGACPVHNLGPTVNWFTL